MQNFFKDKKALIVCRGNSTRGVIRSALLRLDIDNAAIFATKSFLEAIDLMKRNVFEIILVDYTIDQHFGLELSQLQKEQIPDPLKKCFVIIADSGDASAVADSAEEEVEAYLIKPLSEALLLKYLEQIARGKLNPSQQYHILAHGKKLLDNHEFEELDKYMFSNMLYLERPATAYFYLAQAKEIQGKWSEALKNYDLGIAYNPNHFKCLYGKFMMHYRLGQREAAYQVVKLIKVLYPLTPEVLKIAFCVVIETYNFKEVEEYYQIYLLMIRKPDDLKFVVSTALLTAGKALLRRKEPLVPLALNYFVKGSVISGRQTEYIENVIKELIAQGHLDKVNQFFDMFKLGDVPDIVIRPLKFRQYLREKRDENFLLNEGKKMIFDSAADESTIDYVLDLAVTLNQDRLLQSLAFKAMELYPDNKLRYSRFVA